jgi:hypothetical protein
VTLIALPGPGMRASNFELQLGELLGKCVHLFGVKLATDHKSRKRRVPATRDIAAEGALCRATLSAVSERTRWSAAVGLTSRSGSVPPPLTTVPLETRSRSGDKNLSPWETNSNLSPSETKSVSLGDKIVSVGDNPLYSKNPFRFHKESCCYAARARKPRT